MSERASHPALMRFLQEELAIPAESLRVAMHRHTATPDLFPMTLWQYGLVSLPQLERILNWLDTASE